MDVVIVPPPRLGGIYEDNRIWARQFVNHDSGSRRLIDLSNVSPNAVVLATGAAAVAAGQNGQVIYAVGHGASGSDGHLEAGSADLAPRRSFRITQFVAFFNVSTSWSGHAIAEMERTLPRQQRGPAVERWCTRYIASECATARRELRDRSRVQPFYDGIGQIYRRNPVRRVILLTCNVGSATDFLDEVSTDWGVPVAGYTRRAMSRSEGRGQRRRVWMYLEGDQPDQGTNTDAAMTQLMPGATRRDQMSGTVRRSTD